MINENWYRWIFASVSKHFYDNRGNYALYVEGQDRLPENLSERAELRMNGPFFNETSKDEWTIDIDVNLLLNITLNDEDSHKQHRIVGFFTKLFTRDISVYKYGDTEDDDNTYLGCLVMKQFRGDDISITNYGQVAPDIRVTQVTIDSIYRMNLTNK